MCVRDRVFLFKVISIFIWFSFLVCHFICSKFYDTKKARQHRTGDFTFTKKKQFPTQNTDTMITKQIKWIDSIHYCRQIKIFCMWVSVCVCVNAWVLIIRAYRIKLFISSSLSVFVSRTCILFFSFNVFDVVTAKIIQLNVMHPLTAIAGISFARDLLYAFFILFVFFYSHNL